MSMKSAHIKRIRFNSLVCNAFLLLCSQLVFAHPPPPPTCLTSRCEVVQWPSGTVAITGFEFFPKPPVCDWIWIFPVVESTPSLVTTQLVWSPPGPECPPITGSYQSWPMQLNSKLILETPTGEKRTYEGGSLHFYPDVGGKWKVTCELDWAYEDPCTKQPYGGGTISASSSFDVIRLEITPAITNALINRCQDPNRAVKFCLTNSYYPGGVTWSLEPDNVPDGARITGAGDCATVTIGNVERWYMVIARANANTNCAAYAHLRVDRDCDCKNHVISPSPFYIPDRNNGSCPPWGYWEGDPVSIQCGNTVHTVQLKCVGYVRLELDGGLVGHCPYLPSNWDAEAWKCGCGAVIMKTHFAVVNTGPTNSNYCFGKDEYWSCTNGYLRKCWTTTPPPDLLYGPRIDRTNCAPEDSIAPDDPYR